MGNKGLICHQDEHRIVVIDELGTRHEWTFATIPEEDFEHVARVLQRVYRLGQNAKALEIRRVLQT